MEMLFGLYILALCGIIFIGYKAVRDVSSRKTDNLTRIARLQHWEYLRSLKKDGFE